MGGACLNVRDKCYNKNESLKCKTIRLDFQKDKEDHAKNLQKIKSNIKKDIEILNKNQENSLNQPTPNNFNSNMINFIELIEEKNSYLSENKSSNNLMVDNLENEFDKIFSLKILDEINKARKNFLEYSIIIKNFSNKIQKEKDTNKNFIMSHDNKLYFQQEKSHFLECASYLEKLEKKKFEENIKYENFIFEKDLIIPISDNDRNCCTEDKFLKENLNKMKKKFKGRFDINKFLFFKSTKCPITSFAIQLVIDFNRKEKEKYFLDEKSQYIGINYKINKDGIYGIFLTFAN